MKVRLRQQSVAIRAPRSVVFELVSSFGGGVENGEGGDAGGPFGKDDAGKHDADKHDEGKRLVERDGNRLVMEFHSRDGRRMYRTLEEVMLYPEERITFRHLEGPLYHSLEEFVFTEVDSGTMMSHGGEIECRMHWLPGAGWAVARFYVKRRYEQLVLRHMNSLKEQAEGGTSD